MVASSVHLKKECLIRRRIKMNREILESYVVFKEGTGFTAQGQVTGNVLESGPHADEVIQAAIAALGNEGGEVALQRGTFLLERPIQMMDRVALRGCGRGTRLRLSSSFAGEGAIVAQG